VLELKKDEEAPITLTLEAVEQIKLAMKEDCLELNTHFLRCGVVGGGCAGLQFSLDFEENPKEFDYTFYQNDLGIVVDCIGATYLEGVSIDYQILGFQSGFKFDFPKDEEYKDLKQCGCGSSFSI